MKHPSDEELWIGLLDDSQDSAPASVAAHLAEGCDRCDRRLNEFRSVVLALRAGRLEEVPTAWMDNAREWIRAHSSPEAAVKEWSAKRELSAMVHAIVRAMEDIQAAIVLDTAAGALLPGVRGAVAASDRQILCDSTAGQILLRVIEVPSGQFDLQGQFLSERPDFDSNQDRITLLSADREIVQAMSAGGEFRFDAVPPGFIRLRIEGAAYRVTTNPMELNTRTDA